MLDAGGDIAMIDPKKTHRAVPEGASRTNAEAVRVALNVIQRFAFTGYEARALQTTTTQEDCACGVGLPRGRRSPRTGPPLARFPKCS